MMAARPRVYVCFSAEDAAYAQAYLVGLRAAGIDAWADEANTNMVGNRRRLIERELATREHFVALVSPAALASERFNAEMDAALGLAGQRRLSSFALVLVAPCVLPALLRRYALLAAPGGQPLPPRDAIARTLDVLRTPALAQPYIPPAKNATGAWGRLYRVRRVMLLVTLPIALLLLVCSFALPLITRNNAAIANGSGAETPVASSGQTGLLALWMVSPSDGWAVGESGLIERYTNGMWRVQPSPTLQDLFSIQMLPGGAEGWAGGRNGLILHFSHGVWAVQEPEDALPLALNFVQLAMVSSSDGWALDDASEAYRYHQGTWASDFLPLDYHDASGTDQGITAHAISALSASDCWIAGTSDDGDLVLLHDDGASWSLAAVVPLKVTPLRLVMRSDTDGWIAGSSGSSGVLLHYDGTRWSTVYTSAANDTSAANAGASYLAAVAPLSDADVWAVGGVGGNDALGDSGTLLLLHCQQEHCASASLPQKITFTDSYLQVQPLAANDVWALAGGYILHYAGDAWQIVS